MKTPISVLLIMIMICVLSIISCKKSQPAKCDGKGSTYASSTKAIINANCTSSGCHPSYTTYSGLREVLNNGKFKEKVLQTKEMPKGRSLGSDDLIKIQCWADAGFPEN